MTFPQRTLTIVTVLVALSVVGFGLAAGETDRAAMADPLDGLREDVDGQAPSVTPGHPSAETESEIREPNRNLSPRQAFAASHELSQRMTELEAPAPLELEAQETGFPDGAIVEQMLSARSELLDATLHGVPAASLPDVRAGAEDHFPGPKTADERPSRPPWSLPLEDTAPGIDEAEQATDALATQMSHGDPDEYDDHPPIVIESNEDFSTCACVRWGIGTVEDPYVISGWHVESDAPGDYMTADGRSFAVKIHNTDAHFLFRDNLITEADPSDQSAEAHAFDIENVTNAHIADNVVRDIGNAGQIGEIYVGRTGIVLEDRIVQDIHIEGNLFENNQDDGLDVIGEDVTLAENLVRDGGGLRVRVDDSRILGNVLDNSNKIRVWSSQNVDIFDNKVVNGPQATLVNKGSGMHLSGTSLHISENTIDGHFSAADVQDTTIENNVVDSNLFIDIWNRGETEITVANNTFYSASVKLSLHDFSFENNTLRTQPDGFFHWCCGADGLVIGQPENGTIKDNDIQALGEWDGTPKIYTVGSRSNDRSDGIQLYGLPADRQSLPDGRGSTYANNSIEGFDTCVRTGAIVSLHPLPPFDIGIPDQRWEDNSLKNCDLAWHLDASPNQTLRNNTAMDVETGVQYRVMKIADVYQDIDRSNTIEGQPMLWLVGEDGVELDDPDQPYSFIGVTDSSNVTIANMTLSDRAERVFAFNATGLTLHNLTLEDNKRVVDPAPSHLPATAVEVTFSRDVTVVNSTFGQNQESISGIAADLHVRENTFHGDEVESVRAVEGSPTIADNAFTAIDPPAWFPDELHAGVVVEQTSDATIRNNTFENDVFGILTAADEGTTITDNTIRGGTYAISTVATQGAEIRNNTVERTLYGIDVTLGLDQAVLANNTLEEIRYFGFTAIDAEDVRIDNNLVTSRTLGIVMHEHTAFPLEAYGNITRNLVLVDGLEDRQLAGVFTNDRGGDHPTRIANNTIYPGPRGAGVLDDHDDYWSGCQTPNEYQVENNEIRWALAGIVIQCENSADTDPAPTQIHGNRIAGNEKGLIAFPFEGRINATGNWWGAVDGPNAEGNDGSGDPIDNRGSNLAINAVPWLESPPTRAEDITLNAEITNTDPTTDTVDIDVSTAEGADVYLVPGTRELPRKLGTGSSFVYDYIAPGDYVPVVAAKDATGAAIEGTRIEMPSHDPSLSPSTGTAVIEAPTTIDLGFETNDGFPARSHVAFGDGDSTSWQTTSFTPPEEGNPDSLARQSSGSASKGAVTVLTDGPPKPYVGLVEARYGPVEVTLDLADALRADVPEQLVPALENESWVRGISDQSMGEPALDTVRQELETQRAWNRGLVGEDVTIVTIDTGVNESHPDLAGQVKASFDFSDQNCNEDGERETGATEPCPGTDDELGHGTATAGMMAGTGVSSGSRYTGVAPGVQLVDLRVTNDNHEVPEDWMVDALEWIDDHREEYDIDVVYNGIIFPCHISTPGRGTTYVCDETWWNEPLVPMVNNLTEQGLPLVTPAGHEGWRGPDSIELPGHAWGPITVGTVSDRGTPSAEDDVRPSWSGQGGPDQGLKPDIVAPGIAITAPSSLGGGYLQGDGSSGSTAQVAGLVALMLDRNPELTPQEIKDTLNATAVRPAGMDEAAPNTRYGHGVANAQAVEAVGGGVPFEVAHTYEEPGVYEISALAIDSLADEIEARTQVAVHGVIPAFEVLTQTPRALVNVSFTDDSHALPGADLTYEWAFGDGSVAEEAGPMPDHSYEAPGDYEVTLTVTEAGYGSWSASDVVHVEPSKPGVHVLEPVDTETGTVSDAIVLGETTRLRVTANPNGGEVDHVTIYPEGKGGPSLDATQQTEDLWTVAYGYANTGDHTVLVEVGDDDGFVGNATRSVEVVDNAPPEAAGLVDRAVQGLAQVSLDASDSFDPEGRPVSFNWSVSDGSGSVWLAERAEVSWVPSSVGVWTVEVTVTDSLGAQATETARVLVDDRVEASLTLLSADGDPGSVGVTERPVVALAVVDQAGGAVGGAEVTITVTPEVGGSAMAREVTARSSSTGVVLERLPFDVGEGVFGFNLHGEHRVEVVVEADSDPAAPVDDVERFVGEMSYAVHTTN